MGSSKRIKCSTIVKVNLYTTRYGYCITSLLHFTVGQFCERNEWKTIKMAFSKNARHLYNYERAKTFSLTVISTDHDGLLLNSLPQLAWMLKHNCITCHPKHFICSRLQLKQSLRVSNVPNVWNATMVAIHKCIQFRRDRFHSRWSISFAGEVEFNLNSHEFKLFKKLWGGKKSKTTLTPYLI